MASPGLTSVLAAPLAVLSVAVLEAGWWAANKKAEDMSPQ